MSEAKQTERKELRILGLCNTQELVVHVVDKKKLEFSIVDKVDNKKLELSIADKYDELKELAKKWCCAKRSLIVFLVVVVALKFMNLLAWVKWQVCPLWWLLPTAILGVGLFVQFLDAYLSKWWLECVNKVYKKLKAKEDKKPKGNT